MPYIFVDGGKDSRGIVVRTRRGPNVVNRVGADEAPAVNSVGERPQPGGPQPAPQFPGSRLDGVVFDHARRLPPHVGYQAGERDGVCGSAEQTGEQVE